MKHQLTLAAFAFCGSLLIAPSVSAQPKPKTAPQTKPKREGWELKTVSTRDGRKVKVWVRTTQRKKSDYPPAGQYDLYTHQGSGYPPAGQYDLYVRQGSGFKRLPR